MISSPIEVPQPSFEDEKLLLELKSTSTDPYQIEYRSLQPSYNDVSMGRNSIEFTGRLEVELPKCMVSGFHHAPRSSGPTKLLLRRDGTSLHRPNSRATDTTASRAEYLRSTRERLLDSRSSKFRLGGDRSNGLSNSSKSIVSELSDEWADSISDANSFHRRALPKDIYSDSIFIPQIFSRRDGRRGRTASADQAFKRTTGATLSHSMKRPLTAMRVGPVNGHKAPTNEWNVGMLYEDTHSEISSFYDTDSSTITSFFRPVDVSVDNISNSLVKDRKDLVHKLQSREARSNLALLEPRFQHRAVVNNLAANIKGRRQVIDGRKPKNMIHPFVGKDINHSVKEENSSSGAHRQKKTSSRNSQGKGQMKIVEEPGIWGPGRISWIVHATHGKFKDEIDESPTASPCFELAGDYPPWQSSNISSTSVSSVSRMQRYGDKIRHEHMYGSTKAAHKVSIKGGGTAGYKSPIALARQTEAMSKARRKPAYHPWTFFDSQRDKQEPLL